MQGNRSASKNKDGGAIRVECAPDEHRGMAKAEISGNSDLTPDLLELRFIIDWLMSVGVSSPRLAALFGTSAGNIRRLKYLASRQLEPPLITFLPDLDLVPSTAMHRGIGIRSHKDILRRADKPSPTLDWLRGEIDTRFERHRQQYQAPRPRQELVLRGEIDTRFERHRQQYQFLAGARSLGQLKQRLGHMSESRRIALAGVLEQRISWFLVHSGFSRSAISHASLSLWLLQSAHYRLGSREEVREFIKSTLIAAHANLLAAWPAAALQILDFMRAASESIGAPLGSDYYRQRGIAFFQLGNKHDDEAKASFAQSERKMRKLGEGESEAEALMTGTRHINLLGKPDWDEALRVMEMAENTFRSDSLEASMTRHWAAACGLLTGDGPIRQRTRELLAVNQQTAARFGHQATVSKLLSLTPELGLSRGLEAIWVRKALYQNAFRLK